MTDEAQSKDEGKNSTEKSRLVPSPFLYVDPELIRDPHRGEVIARGSPGFLRLYAWARGEVTSSDPEDESLAAAGWLRPVDAPPLDRDYRIRYVSIETQAACNQACWFCPVSEHPRTQQDLPLEAIASIADQLRELSPRPEVVFLTGYNEPTADPRMIEVVEILRARELLVAILSNGSGLTASRSDALVQLGGVEFLSVNLSTLDRARYHSTRGRDHLARVLSNLDYAATRNVAVSMRIVVLGSGDSEHDASHQAIAARFAGTRFTVERHVANDRAGLVPALSPAPSAERPRRLAGCEQMGSRPIEHLHVSAKGHALLCCQDYEERHRLGDLIQERVDTVLRSDAFARARRQVYGLEASDADLPCWKCAFARFA